MTAKALVSDEPRVRNRRPRRSSVGELISLSAPLVSQFHDIAEGQRPLSIDVIN